MILIINRIKTWYQSANDNEKDWLYLGVPLLISLVIKLILLAALYNSPINNDGTLYINAAKHYAMGNFAEGLRLYSMPAYPMALAFIHIVIPNWIIAGIFISLASIVLVTIPLYFLTKIMFDNKVAFWTCLVFAILPNMNEWSFKIIRDPLFLLLFISSVYFALRSILEKDFFLFGATFIFAYLATFIRIEGAFFIGFYCLTLIYLTFSDKENRIRFLTRSIIWIGILFFPVLIVLLSADIRSIALNRFDNLSGELLKFISGNFLNRFLRIYDALSEIGSHKPFRDGHYSFITLCRHYMPLIYVLGIIQAIAKIIFPLSLIPLYFGFKNRENRFGNSGKFIFWILILFLGLGYYVLIRRDFIATRWVIIPTILLLPWVGSGINQLFTKAATSLHKKLILFLIVLIILAPTIKTFGLISSRDITTAYTLKWLKAHDKINKVQIVSNNFKDSFYFDLAAQEQADPNWKIHYYNKRKNSKSIENFALKKNAQIIVFKVKTKDVDKMKGFHYYKNTTTIAGNRYTTFIYIRI